MNSTASDEMRGSPMSEISRDVWIVICSLTGYRSLRRFSSVCRHWRDVCHDDSLWRDLVSMEWAGVDLDLSQGWPGFSSWSAVWRALNDWGEYEGCHQCIEFHPYGILCAVYFTQGTLVCDALLPQGTARLFQAGFHSDGTVAACTMLPDVPEMQCEGDALTLHRAAEEFEHPAASSCPNLHRLCLCFGEAWIEHIASLPEGPRLVQFNNYYDQSHADGEAPAAPTDSMEAWR